MPVAAAIGSIGGALISAAGAKSAAKTQANAAKEAASISAKGYKEAGDITSKAATEAANLSVEGYRQGGAAQLDALTKALETIRTGGDAGVSEIRSSLTAANDYLAPYRDTGKAATYSLADLYGLPTPANPNGGRAMNDNALAAFRASPDYEFARAEGIRGVDSSAAARGMLLSGGTLKGVADYASGLATQTFGNYVSRLQALASMGETAASTSGQQALNAGTTIADILGNNSAKVAAIQGSIGDVNAGTAQGMLEAQAKGVRDAANALAIGKTGENSSYATGIRDAGNANAAGTVAAVNSIGGGLADAFNNLALYQYLKNNNASLKLAA